MNRSLLVAALVATSALAASAIAIGAFGNFGAQAEQAAAPFRLVERVPFELSTPSVQDWRSESPTYTSGDLVVLEARDLDLVPTQMPHAVLLCGAEPVQRLNRGTSGVIVGIVPHCADIGASAAGPYHLGAPALPERLDSATTRGELEAALTRGLRPIGQDALADVSGETMYFTDENQLVIFAADLVERWAHDEADTARGLRGTR